MPWNFSGLVAARIVSKTRDQCGVGIIFATSGGGGGRDDHVDATDGTDRPRR